MPHPRRVVFLFMMTLLAAADSRSQQPRAAQPVSGAISKADRERALDILDHVSKGIKDAYYDPKMNGLDWNAVTETARAKIVASNSMNEALTQIAIAVSALNDSHTIFLPPHRTHQLDFGFERQMIWNRCFITRVRPGSDGEAKGLKPGDEILSINGTTPNRQNLSSIEYLDYVLDPRSEMRLQVKDPSGEKHEMDVKAKVTRPPSLMYRTGGGAWYDAIRANQNVRHRMRMRLMQLGDVGVLKVPWFYYDVEDFYVLGHKLSKDQVLIVDLRGNPGGATTTLKYFIGMFFDHDVKVYDRVERKKTFPEVAKSEHPINFRGKVIVLVDSESASAAELFARVMQLEKRGTVMGDRTSGSVMGAIVLSFASSSVEYGAEVTVFNAIMADGQSIEHHGVNPDELMLPQPADLVSGRDPVLAHAAAEVGVKISPEEAGRLFPYEWPKE